MARDFRPKSARQGEVVTKKKRDVEKERPKIKSRKAVSESDNSSNEDDEEGLLKAIQSFGGDKSDLNLISKQKGKAKDKEDDEKDDVSVCKCAEALMESNSVTLSRL
jgi:hypothetical protein